MKKKKGCLCVLSIAEENYREWYVELLYKC